MSNTLVSPGVQVTVVDQSQYLPAATNSVPLMVIATATNKLSSDGTGIAQGTLPANADKLFLATSQRALLANYGVPFFYQTTNGTPINGYELNEYGLLAAYSALGVTNQCYVIRANIDLAALSASLTRPTGNPNNNTTWLDTVNSTWGIYQWNQATSTFTNQIPLVITSSTYLNTGSSVPLQSYGSIGNYAVTATYTTNPIYFKRGGPTSTQSDDTRITSLYNTWALLGSAEWQSSWATVQGTTTPTSVTASNTFTLNGAVITVPAGPNNTVSGIVDAITAAGLTGVYAANVGGALNLYADFTATGVNIAVTGASGDGDYATLTFATQSSAPFAVGSTISVDNITPSGYDGTYVVTACTTTSVTYASAEMGSYVSSGQVGTPTGTIVVGTGSGSVLTTLGITPKTYVCPRYQATPSYQVPSWSQGGSTAVGVTGSIWQKTNNVNLGVNLVLKQYNAALDVFVIKNVPVYANGSSAIYGLDPSGGGENIPASSFYAKSNPRNNGTAGFEIYERYITGKTIVTGDTVNQTFVSGDTFTLAATQPGTASLASATIELTGTTPSDFIAAVSSAAIPYVSASINSNGAIVFTHSAGGNIVLTNGTGSPVTTAGFTASTFLCFQAYVAGIASGIALSNWVSSPTFTYTASSTAPDQNPDDGTYWYYSDPTQVDIMIQQNGAWVGYQTVTSDARGYNLTQCNAAGPIISPTAPTTQTDTSASPLVYGDLWVNTSDLENYPLLSRWQSVNGVDQWVQISNTDATQSNGILFQDARWAPNGVTDPVSGALPSITSLLTSNYLDPDAPMADLYPAGILLWNTRRSGFNVKTYQSNYFNNNSYPTYDWNSSTTYAIGDYVQYNSVVYACIASNTNRIPDVSTTYWSVQTVTATWLTAAGTRPDGSPYMGRQAQREIIVQAMKQAIDTNSSIREEQNSYNLITVPGYPELAINMVALNNEINNVAFAIIDTPLRLSPNDIATWATNNNGLGLATGDGNLAAGDSYGAVFYPSCQTTDLSGNVVVTYPSHMMTRTIIRNDEIAYPWLAPAGTRRGLVDNAFQLGYLEAVTGVFTTLGVGQSMRDVLYTNNINPITFIPGVGITNFGNKTLQKTASALDRINVARLICYVRARLETIGKQYLFEPNDQITRTEITNTITGLLIDIVAKRGIYDYLVVCDTTNNTPTTIDQNQLWVDIAIEPVKAVEFVYIPLRIQNTGTIAAQTVA
jgi:hypothetical protein